MRNLFESKKELLLFYIFAGILLTINITKVIKFNSNISFNIAFSDIFIIFAIASIFFDAIKRKSYKVIKGSTVWIILISWIVLCGYIGIKSESIVDSGWFGILEELIKTGLCITYFLIGFYSPKYISKELFMKIWSMSIIVFIFGGIIIYELSQTGIYLWSDDPKYLQMFMGTDSDPNHAATFLTMSFFSMGLTALSYEFKNNKLWYSIMTVLSGFGVLLTGSRGGILGLFIGLSILFLYYFKKNRKFAVTILCLIILVVLIFIQVDSSLFESTFTKRIAYKFVGIESGFDIRYSLGKVALMMGNDHMLFGVGRGNFILNSGPYFSNLNIERIENIPHNTYFGLYAEVGLVGLFLYLMPLWFIIKAGIKRYKHNKKIVVTEVESLTWIIAAILAIGAQAFVLNVENRRFLWYLAGVITFWIESDLFVFSSYKISSQKKGSGITKILIVVTIISYIILSNIINIPLSSEIIESNSFKYEIPLNSLTLGKENKIGIELFVASNEAFTNRMNISVKEFDEYGNRLLLTSKSYSGVNGQLFINFTPSIYTSKIYLEIDKIDRTLDKIVFRPLSVISNGKIYDLSKWYFLQPNFIADILINKSIVQENIYYPQTQLNLDNNTIIDNKFKLLSVTCLQNNTNNMQKNDVDTILVSLKYQLLDKATDKYVFTLNGYPFDLIDYSDAVLINGFESYNPYKQYDVTNWEIGEIYDVEFVIPRNWGIYRLKAAIRTSREDIWEFLYIDEEIENQRVYLDLGWLNLNK